MINANSFGQTLRELRQNKNMTQSELATVFNTTKFTISAWELSKQEPDINTIMQIAKYFDVTTDYLLGFEN